MIYLPMGALVILLTLPLLGQHYFTNASVAKARGDNEGAIADYRKAIWLEQWYAQNIDTYAAIGELQRQSNFSGSSPERHISKAMEFKLAGEYELAIFEFNRAAEGDGALAAAARRESVRTRADLALALYRTGSIGGAVTNWEQALAEDPSQIYVLPYLARADYDIGRYQAALDVIVRWVRVVADHTSMLGDAYSLGGDCSAKLGRIADARHYYNLALSADNIMNHWAVTGLIGD